MQGLPIALFAATGLSGLLAFGVIQSTYTQQAQALFYVFGAILLVMFAAKKMFGGGGHGHGHGSGHGHGGGDHAIQFSGRTVGTIMIGAAVLAVAYFWTDNQLTAEKMGREIDRGVYALSQQAEATYVAFRAGDAQPGEEETTAQ